MRSKWTHVICVECWLERNSNDPITVKGGMRELCCYCGRSTNGGIYVRDNPNDLRCRGEHCLDETSDQGSEAVDS